MLAPPRFLGSVLIILPPMKHEYNKIISTSTNYVLYLIYMNKEVIYLEPEDDITDILTKLQRAQEKVVALVPPKKATILRSAVNMKLVAKAAKEGEKVAVVVTTDPAILKLAMAAKIPVAKTLQSRPVVPTEEDLQASSAAEQIIDENSDLLDEPGSKSAQNSSKSSKSDDKTSSKASESSAKDAKDKSAEPLELTEESLENGGKDGKNAKKGAQNGQKGQGKKKVPNFNKQRKKIIIGAVSGVLVIALLVWALVFAPAVDIIVAISTSSSNFAETTSFTTNPDDENLEEGKFYATKLTFEQKQEANFTATGQEDKGEKAKGQVTVSKSFDAYENLGSPVSGLSVQNGARFTSGGKTYVATSGGSADGWNGEPPLTCNGKTYNNNGQIKALKTPCQISVTVSVEALNPGEEFNLSGGSSWGAFEGASVSNGSAISGGSTRMVTVVAQSDVNKAKEEIAQRDLEAAKTSLYKQIDDTMLPIEASYQAETSDAVSNPAVGQEVASGVTPNVSATTTYSIYVVDKAKVEEFITKKSNIASDQRIYSYGEPFFERFNNIDEEARLKAITEVGPTVDEEEILNRAKGKKTGEVAADLRSITGVSSVDIRPSFFWVTSVPNDTNKVKVELTVEEN